MKDCVDAIETEQRITDLITEFDEMGFAPTTLHPDPEQYAIDWRDQVRKEFARLITENAALRKRLENAVELPCIEPMTTWDWDDTTGLGKTNFGKYWQILYRDENGEFVAYIGATKEEAEARLAELKGEQK